MQLAPVFSQDPRSHTPPVDGQVMISPRDAFGTLYTDPIGSSFAGSKSNGPTYLSEAESVAIAEASKRQRFQCLQCGKIAQLDLLQEKPSDEQPKDGLFSSWTMFPTWSTNDEGVRKGFVGAGARHRELAVLDMTTSSPFEPKSPRSSPKRLEMNGTLSSTRKDTTLGDVRQSLMFCGEVFEKLSRVTTCDYPMCPSCCSLHLKNLDEEIWTALRTRQHYCNQLPDILEDRNASMPLCSGEALDRLLAMSVHLQEQLDVCEVQIQEAYQEKVTLERERRALEKRQALAARREVRSQVAQMFLIECKVGLSERLEFKQHELRRLLRTNILNEAFYVDAQGPFSFINGLKLLRAPNLQTPQHEINAAWFYMIVFLKVLSEHIGLEFTTYHIRPNGNWSTIYHVTAQTEYELYLGARVWFAGSRHEKATAGFVTCVRELVQGIKQKHPQAGDPPVDIACENSGPLTCFLKGAGSTSDEAWYLGMKALVMTLKWCLYTILTMPR